jgi:ATP-binding cassette subfamily F protein 3
MSLLTFSDVRKAYGAQEVLRGASFFLSPGRKVALVGANGAGKTTLLRLAAGQERPDAGRVVLVTGTRLAALEQEPLVGDARTVLEAAQRPSREHQRAWAELTSLESGLESSSGADELAAYDGAHHCYESLGGYHCETAAREVLAGLGFPAADWQKPIRVLSGGERTRLALVQILVLQPDLLLLDEPTNHVDWEACEWLQGYLVRCAGAALIVSHDRYFLDQVAQEVVHLEEGKTRVYSGNYTTFQRKREAELAQDEERCRREQLEIARQEAIIARLRTHRNWSAMHSREKVLERLGASRPPPAPARALRITAREQHGTGRVALTARELAFSYGARSIFRGLSFTLERGERLAVIGPNGAGKSTLLKVLAGEFRPASGEVSMGYRALPAYFAQDLDLLDPDATVFETVGSAADLGLAETFRVLHQFLFPADSVEKRVGSLSGGERTRLALARLLVGRPNVLLLDEPTNHLDVPSREAVESALAGFPGAVVVASHDRYLLERVPTRLLEIRPGVHRFYDGGYRRYRETLLAAAEPTPARLQRAAAARQTRRPAGESPSKRLRDLERSIEAAERRISDITSLLADPQTYRSESAASLPAEYEELSGRIEALYEQWSELAETMPASKRQ